MRYSLLYAGYKNSRYWYECVMAMRKFLFVILSVFARQWTPRMQAAAIFATISVAALVQLHVKPYINDNPEQKRLHGLEVLNLSVCLATYVGGTCLTYFTASGMKEELYDAKGFECNLLIMCVCVCVWWWWWGG